MPLRPCCPRPRPTRTDLLLWTSRTYPRGNPCTSPASRSPGSGRARRACSSAGPPLRTCRWRRRCKWARRRAVASGRHCSPHNACVHSCAVRRQRCRGGRRDTCCSQSAPATPGTAHVRIPDTCPCGFCRTSDAQRGSLRSRMRPRTGLECSRCSNPTMLRRNQSPVHHWRRTCGILGSWFGLSRSGSAQSRTADKKSSRICSDIVRRRSCCTSSTASPRLPYPARTHRTPQHRQRRRSDPSRTRSTRSHPSRWRECQPRTHCTTPPPPWAASARFRRARSVLSMPRSQLRRRACRRRNRRTTSSCAPSGTCQRNTPCTRRCG